MVEIGPEGSKPLLVYLHGYSQDMDTLKQLTSPLRALVGYHLYIQGPIRVEKEYTPEKRDGFSWYEYSGDPRRFARELERRAAALQRCVRRVIGALHLDGNIQRTGLFGYSMGGYLAAYYSISRPERVNELIVSGCRIKTELFESEWARLRHLNVLALHGRHDRRVLPAPQQKEVEWLRRQGLNATFVELDEGHRLTRSYMDHALRWLENTGYSTLT